MKLKKDNTEQKLRGAYYTPKVLADEIIRLFVTADIASVLEPSCGDGVFLDSLNDSGLLKQIKTIDAIEIEQAEAQKVELRYRNSPQVKVLQQDFFDFYKDYFQQRKYDLIIGNPPYIRYQYLSESQRKSQANILTSHGMKPNKLINAWVAFTVACIQMLSERGKIAFVIPAEVLQVAYAEELRLYLANHLAKITLITFEKLVFSDIEQEVVVLIGEKDKTEKGIRIIEVKDLEDLKHISLTENDFQPIQHVKEKWTKYFVNNEEIKLIQTLKNDERFCQFSDVGVINVGITTGNNDYFSIDEETTQRYKLQNVSLPLIGRSSHAHGIFFTQQDWELNKSLGKSARLLCFPDIPYEKYPQSHKDYVKKGEEEQQNLGYKCSIRDRWYIVPSVWSPDAFFLRRNNLYPKFVLNHCGAVSTDTMHRIKFKANVNALNVLLGYYNSVSFAFTEICGRSYGGGVLEILPREMGKILLPIVNDIDAQLRTELLNKIDEVVRCNQDIEQALDIVDEEILVKHLGLKREICLQCRSIWKKFQNRRLARG